MEQAPASHRQAAIDDIQARPGQFSALVLVADRAELSEGECAALRTLDEALPCAYVPILAERCLECWALGNRAFVSSAPTERDLVEWMRHYNVRACDPEHLPPRPPRFATVERAADAYLRAAHVQQHAVWNKARPREVARASFVRELCARFADTGHLESFASLVAAIAPGRPALRADDLD